MKRQIAIIAGGDSSEHEVSLRSAAGLYSFMDKERYDITIVRLQGKEWRAYPQPLPEGRGERRERRAVSVMFPRALLAFFNLKVEVWRCNAPLGQRIINV